MNKFYYLPLLILSLSSSAQKHAAPQNLQQAYKDDFKYIASAPAWVPGLLEKGEYRLLENFLDNWENSPHNNPELIFAIRLLQALEVRQTEGFAFHCDALFLLDNYAKELSELQQNGDAFKYYLYLNEQTYYDATPHARTLLLYIQSRAILMGGDKSLDETERFLCAVLSGKIGQPRLAVLRDPSVCPSLSKFQSALDAHNDSVFTARRSRSSGTFALTMGVWSPSGNLGSMGVHPTAGISFGWRNKLNEVNMELTSRYVNACSYYTYVLDDSIYTSKHYDGGVIGFSYTRYLLHRKYFEAGLITGIGWDFIDMTQGKDQGGVQTVSTLAISNGIRFKYFFRQRGYLGLNMQYHLLNYCNTGGSDISGNAWSITFSYGSH